MRISTLGSLSKPKGKKFEEKTFCKVDYCGCPGEKKLPVEGAFVVAVKGVGQHLL